MTFESIWHFWTLSWPSTFFGDGVRIIRHSFLIIGWQVTSQSPVISTWWLDYMTKNMFEYDLGGLIDFGILLKVHMYNCPTLRTKMSPITGLQFLADLIQQIDLRVKIRFLIRTFRVIRGVEGLLFDWTGWSWAFWNFRSSP